MSYPEHNRPRAVRPEETIANLAAQLNAAEATLAAVRELAGTWTKAEHPEGFIEQLLAILDREREK